MERPSPRSVQAASRPRRSLFRGEPPASSRPESSHASGCSARRRRRRTATARKPSPTRASALTVTPIGAWLLVPRLPAAAASAAAAAATPISQPRRRHADDLDYASKKLEKDLERRAPVLRHKADAGQVDEPRVRGEVPHGGPEPGGVDAPAVRRHHVGGVVGRSVGRDERRVGRMPQLGPAPGRTRLRGGAGRQRPGRRAASDCIAAAGEPDDPQMVVIPDDDVGDVLPRGRARAAGPGRRRPGASPDALGVDVQRGSRQQAARHDRTEPGRHRPGEAAERPADRPDRPPIPTVAGRIAPPAGIRVAHSRDITPGIARIADADKESGGPRLRDEGGLTPPRIGGSSGWPDAIHRF